MQFNLTQCSLAFAGLFAATGLPGETPDIRNADLQSITPNAELATTVDPLVRRADEAVWIGYSTAKVDGRGALCCHGDGQSCCGICSLEDNRHEHSGDSSNRPVRLETAGEITVLMRAEGRNVVELRVFSADCAVDAGGRTVHWLGSVAPDAGVQYLSRFVDDDRDGSRVAKRAVTAIAHHRGSSAVTALSRFAREGRPFAVRKDAAFWLGAARGQQGFEALRELVRTQTDQEFRKKAVFALSVSSAAGAVDELIRLARQDDSAVVRKAALFWLSQKAGDKAAEAIAGAVEHDPETEVKKKAVFALSQLPPEEGVPLLIKVARNNSNPDVRKKAAFWLGQKDAPAAIDFFEEILK